MHGIYSDVTRPSSWIRFPPFPGRHRRRPRRLIRQPPLPVPHAVPQPVQMRHRQLRQALVTPVPELVAGPLEKLLRGWPAQRLVGLVHFRQQRYILALVPPREPVPPVRRHPHFLAGQVLRDQPSQLAPAPPGHLLQVAPHQSPPLARQFLVVLLPRGLIHKPVDLRPVPALKGDLPGAGQERPDLLQAQCLFCLHADGQSPAWRIAPVPGSSCVRNAPLLQAHLLRNTCHEPVYAGLG